MGTCTLRRLGPVTQAPGASAATVRRIPVPPPTPEASLRTVGAALHRAYFPGTARCVDQVDI